MTAMDITIHASFLPHDDPDAALAFYRDALGFEVRNQFEYGGKHWNTVGPPGQPDVNIVLHPPGADPDPWIEAGATWCLTSFGLQPGRVEVERAIDAG